MNTKKPTPDQEGATPDGSRRMERGQTFAVLTAEQRTEVRKQLATRSGSARAEPEKKKEQQSLTTDVKN